MRHTMEKMLRNHDGKYIDKVTAKNIQLDFTLDVDNKLEELNLSRQDLAKGMNVSKSYISDILNGHKLVNLTTIAKINRVLGFYTSLVSESKEAYIHRVNREREGCTIKSFHISKEFMDCNSSNNNLKPVSGTYESTHKEWIKGFKAS